MATFRYSPPAEQNDFVGNPKEDELLQQWSETIGAYFNREIRNLQSILQQEPLFFSGIDRSLANSVPTAAVPWNGFPRNIQLRVNNDRTKQFQLVETREKTVIGYTDSTLSQEILQPYRQQDEYLEWVPIKQGGQVVKYAFTSEGPEYWEFLAETDRNKVLALYKEFTGRDVAWAELAWERDVWGQDRSGTPVRIYEAGSYNPYNNVNVAECAAHLTHPANTLGAEIDLAAKATVQRSDRSGNLVSERRRLACCSDFGDPNRNSDPQIGATVNQSVRGGISLTLADPVGLYIQSFDRNRIADKNGNALADWWKIIRGKDGRVLRAEFGPPANSPLTLADVRVGAEQLTAGGQLAELITMVLYARVTDLNVPEPASRPSNHRCCVEKGKNPNSSLLAPVLVNSPCPTGFINAFPELGQAQPLSPFDRRGAGRRGGG